MTDAACADRPPGPWDPDASPDQQAHALAVCTGCPVTTDCAAYAAREGLAGVWGGRYVPAVAGALQRRQDAARRLQQAALDLLGQGLGHAATAERLGVSVDRLRSALRRARLTA